MRPVKKTMQCFHECLCGAIMRQGPGLMQCPDCRLTLTRDERIDLVNAAYDLGNRHHFEGSPRDATSRYGPFFKGEYYRGYTFQDRSFEK